MREELNSGKLSLPLSISIQSGVCPPSKIPKTDTAPPSLQQRIKAQIEDNNKILDICREFKRQEIRMFREHLIKRDAMVSKIEKELYELGKRQPLDKTLLKAKYDASVSLLHEADKKMVDSLAAFYKVNRSKLIDAGLSVLNEDEDLAHMKRVLQIINLDHNL